MALERAFYCCARLSPQILYSISAGTPKSLFQTANDALLFVHQLLLLYVEMLPYLVMSPQIEVSLDILLLQLADVLKGPMLCFIIFFIHSGLLQSV